MQANKQCTKIEIYKKYTVFRKKTPIHIFFHISMNDKQI